MTQIAESGKSKIIFFKSSCANMVQTILQEQSVEIIDGTTVDVKARVVTVKGKRGTLVRDFKHLNVDIKKIKIKGKDAIQVKIVGYL
jgi:ribosomal protein L6P/L9E